MSESACCFSLHSYFVQLKSFRFYAFAAIFSFLLVTGALFTNYDFLARSVQSLPMRLQQQKLPQSGSQLPSISYNGVIQQSEPCPSHAPTGRARADGRWFNFSSSSFQLYIYRAWYDDREMLWPRTTTPPPASTSTTTTPMPSPVPRTPVAYVRLISIATKDDVLQKKSVRVSLFCRLYYHNYGKTRRGRNSSSAADDVWASTVLTRVVAVDPVVKHMGYGWDMNGETAREHIYSCPLYDVHETGIPTAVSVIRDSAEDSSADKVLSCMPVEVPPRPSPPPAARLHNVAVCSSCTYGSGVNPLRLIEWLEMQRLLGVELVGIHLFNVTGPALDVFLKYAAEGFVDLWMSAYIPDGDREDQLHASPAINDCIYRLMYLYRWIVVIDLDELIVPENGNTPRIIDLLDYVDQSYISRSALVPVNYVFRNSYYFTDIPTDPFDSLSGPGNLTLVRHRKKVPLSPPGYSVKSIIDPQMCINMHNHYCWTVAPGHGDRPWDREVDPNLATNRHYKKCHFWPHECAEMIRNATRDDVMLRYRHPLEDAVRRKLKTDFRHMSVVIRNWPNETESGR